MERVTTPSVNSSEKGLIAMNGTLVYASKSGATEEAAQIIGDVLKNKYELDAEIANLRRLSNLVQYRNVVVCSGVRSGRGRLKFNPKPKGFKSIAT